MMYDSCWSVVPSRQQCTSKCGKKHLAETFEVLAAVECLPEEGDREDRCSCRLFTVDSPVLHQENEASCLSTDISLGLSALASVRFSTRSCYQSWRLSSLLTSLPSCGPQVPVMIYPGLHFLLPEASRVQSLARAAPSWSPVKKPSLSPEPFVCWLESNSEKLETYKDEDEYLPQELSKLWELEELCGNPY
ncbi:hypothetical protein A6R68_00040, partial [Neotoma lepida]